MVLSGLSSHEDRTICLPLYHNIHSLSVLSSMPHALDFYEHYDPFGLGALALETV